MDTANSLNSRLRRSGLRQEVLVAAAGALLVAITNGGCAVKKIAVNKLGNALANGGTTYASDNDPELIRDAVPFSLKLMESLLEESPKHRGLLLATSKEPVCASLSSMRIGSRRPRTREGPAWGLNASTTPTFLPGPRRS